MVQQTPVEILSYWDFYIFGFGLLIRLLASAVRIAEDKSHFDVHKLITVSLRVTLHIVSSLAIMLSLPHFIVTTSFTIKYLSQWSFLGSLLVGFAGYDLVKWVGIAAKRFGLAAIKRGVKFIENLKK